MRIVHPQRRLRFALLVACTVATPVASAAPCEGFTDVLSTNSFCPNVAWLRNREITLGCSSSTLFCPANAVSRLSMAAFLNRLGNVLSPTHASATESAATDIAIDPGQVVCATTFLEFNGGGLINRTVRAEGTIGFGPSTGTVDVSVEFVRRTAGAWQTVSGFTQTSTRTGAGTGSVSLMGTDQLGSGVTYQYGMRVMRGLTSPNGTDQTGPWRCEIKVALEHYIAPNGI